MLVRQQRRPGRAMRRHLTRFVVAVAATAAVAAISACGSSSSSSSGSPEGGGSIVVAKDMASDLSFDPARAFEELYQPLFGNVYQHLVGWAPAKGGYDYSKVVPQLATEWEGSKDAKTWTFTLDPDAKFASGNAVTGEDVAWSYRRFINVQGPPSHIAADIADVTSPDPATVVFELKNPNPNFPAVTTTPNLVVLDSKLVKENGGTDADDASKTDTAEQWLTTNSAGSGPYQIDSFEPGQKLVLKRVEDWWGGDPAPLAQVVFTNIPDASARVTAIQRGDIDIAWTVVPQQADELADNPDVSVLEADPNHWYYMSMNGDPKINAFTADPKVREALRYATDWDGLANLCAGNPVQPVFGLAPVSLGGGGEEVRPGQDLEKAKQLLAEAGYPDGYDGPLRLQTFQWSGFCPLFSDIVQKLASDWAKVGVKADVKVRNYDSWITDFRKGDFDVNISDWLADYPSAVNAAGAALPGGALAERTQWKGQGGYAEMERVTKELAGTTSTSGQEELLHEAERMNWQLGTTTYLIQIPDYYPYRADLAGVAFHAQYRFDFYNMARK